MCRVCRSPARRAVEVALAEGRSYAEIAGVVPDSRLSPRNIAEHYRRGHLPLDSDEVREIVAERALDNGSIVQVGIDRQAEALRLAQAVVRRTWEGVAAGEIEPTFKDGIAAARLLMKYDAVAFERSRLREQVKRSHRAVSTLLRLTKDIVTAEQWSALGRAVDGDAEIRPFWPAPGAEP
jgi:hypothetical protein